MLNKFAAVSNAFREELLRQYREWNPSSNAQDETKVKGAYDEILQFELDAMNGVSSFVSKYAKDIRVKLGGSSLAWARQAVEVADNFENLAATTQMRTD